MPSPPALLTSYYKFNKINMEKAKNYQEYVELRKVGLYNHYIWKWSKNKEYPNNWLSSSPIKIFGFCIGWKVKVVKSGYENLFFTSPHYNHID